MRAKETDQRQACWPPGESSLGEQLAGNEGEVAKARGANSLSEQGGKTQSLMYGVIYGGGRGAVCFVALCNKK